MNPKGLYLNIVFLFLANLLYVVLAVYVVNWETSFIFYGFVIELFFAILFTLTKATILKDEIMFPNNISKFWGIFIAICIYLLFFIPLERISYLLFFPKIITFENAVELTQNFQENYPDKILKGIFIPILIFLSLEIIKLIVFVRQRKYAGREFGFEALVIIPHIRMVAMFVALIIFSQVLNKSTWEGVSVLWLFICIKLILDYLAVVVEKGISNYQYTSEEELEKQELEKQKLMNEINEDW